jgi:hypothetical protein
MRKITGRFKNRYPLFLQLRGNGPQNGVILVGVDFIPQAQAREVGEYITKDPCFGDGAEKYRLSHLMPAEKLNGPAQLSQLYPATEIGCLGNRFIGFSPVSNQNNLTTGPAGRFDEQERELAAPGDDADTIVGGNITHAV